MTHPNIHTPSLHKWLDEARLERQKRRLEEQREHDKKGKE